MKKLTAAVSICAFILLSFCFTSLFASLDHPNAAESSNHECCTFSAGHHHKDFNGVIAYPEFLVPAVILVFVLTLITAYRPKLFVAAYTPYFSHRFFKGVLQLE